MADIAVPELTDLDGALQLLCPVSSGSTSINPAMTQRGDSSSEEEAQKPGDASTSKATAGKKKRTQFSSCDACRLRKVKCIREEGQVECNNCISKNIACTRVFSQTNAHGKGKRINQARDQFGTKVEGTDETGTSSSSSTSPPVLVQSVTTCKMNEHVLSAKALCAFLQAYETDVASAIPALEYARIFEACDKVAFDINRLDELDRVLCIAAAAVTASVQQCDRKFGVGQSAIVIQEPLAIKKDLETRVLEEADRLGILRKPSLRTLETLRLFCILTSGEAARQLRRSDSYRAYEQALVEHMRSLYEGGQLSEQKVAEYFWSMILGDSFACALSGRSPSFSAEDIQNFASYVDYSTEGMIMIINHMDLSSAEAGFGLIFASICQLCRSFYNRVTSFQARKRPFVDVAMFQEMPPEMERVNGIMGICQQKLDSLFGKHGWPAPLAYWGRVVRFLHTFIMVMALNELETAIVKELSGNVSLHRLHILQQTMEQLQLRTMTELQANFGWEPKPGSDISASRILASVDGLLAFFSVLRMQRIFKLPSLEEGACVGSWSIADKVANAQYYMKVCDFLGCAVPEVGAELPNLHNELTRLEQRAKALAEQSLSYNQPDQLSRQEEQGPSIIEDPFPGYPSFPVQTGANPGLSTEIKAVSSSQSIGLPAPEAPNVRDNLDLFQDFDFLAETLQLELGVELDPFSSSSGFVAASPDLQFEQFLNNLE